MPQRYATHHGNQGFTLLELSVVLVIIGLIIGAYFVGRDLIRAAELRAFVSQIEKYNAAVRTFQSKYNGNMPGDMGSTDAAQLNFATRVGSDGNGLLRCTTQSPVGTNFGGENALFWNDLATANLIPGHYSGADCDCVLSSCAATTTADGYVPQANLGKGNYIIVYGDPAAGNNFYQIVAGITAITANGTYTGVTAAALSSIDAYNIDKKIDDALPLTGLVTARDVVLLGWAVVPGLVTPAAPAVGVCVSDAANNPYNINSSTGGGSAACSIRISFN